MKEKLLLHCCCAPCSVSCIESFNSEGIKPFLFWYNPNIHPFTEYQSRKKSLLLFCEKEKLNLSLLDEYGLRFFLENIYPHRCEKCYSIRLEKTALHAVQNGYNAFSTTLLISPYQKHDVIKSIGEEIARKYRIDFFYRDFRPLFRDGQKSARSMGMYMQKYCGCIFSEEERYLQHEAL